MDKQLVNTHKFRIYLDKDYFNYNADDLIVEASYAIVKEIRLEHTQGEASELLDIACTEGSAKIQTDVKKYIDQLYPLINCGVSIKDVNYNKDIDPQGTNSSQDSKGIVEYEEYKFIIDKLEYCNTEKNFDYKTLLLEFSFDSKVVKLDENVENNDVFEVEVETYVNIDKEYAKLVEGLNTRTKRAINIALGRDKDSSENIYQRDLLTITSIISHPGVINEEFQIEHIASMPLLQHLDIDNFMDATITNLDFISNNLYLRNLTLTNNNIKDISVLSKFSRLKSVDLSNNKVDLSTLGYLKKIESLNLGYNELQPDGSTQVLMNIDKLTTLIELNLAGNNLTNKINGIDNVDKLTSLVNLKRLYISSNKLTNLDFLDNGIIDLSNLGCVSNQIADFTVIDNFTSMYYLTVSSNPITDVAQLLESIRAHTELNTLYLGKLEIDNLEFLDELLLLEDLKLDYNKIDNTQMSHIGKLVNLIELSLIDNSISNVDDILKLTKLQILKLSRNQISNEEAKKLASLEYLYTLWISNNYIYDITPFNEIPDFIAIGQTITNAEWFEITTEPDPLNPGEILKDCVADASSIIYGEEANPSYPQLINPTVPINGDINQLEHKVYWEDKPNTIQRFVFNFEASNQSGKVFFKGRVQNIQEI